MQCCIISFRNIASFCGDDRIQKTIKQLSEKGIFISQIMQISENKNAFSEAVNSCLKYNYIFILDSDKLNYSVEEELNLLSKNEMPFFYSYSNTGIFLLSKSSFLLEEYINSAVKLINAKQKEYYGKTVIKVFCFDKVIIEETVEKAKKLAGNLLKIYHSSIYFDTSIEIVYNNLTPKVLIDDIIRLINKELFEFIYSLDGKELNQCLFDILTVRKLRLSCAESFTGGGIAKKIIEIPGASTVFFEGITAYANKAKVQRLNVSQTTINTYSAVSDQTAYEMACGLLETNNCDIALATTGIAGPMSEGDKPKGLCFIAVGYNKEIEIFKYYLKGDRQEITMTAINAAMFLAIKKIK